LPPYARNDNGVDKPLFLCQFGGKEEEMLFENEQLVLGLLKDNKGWMSAQVISDASKGKLTFGGVSVSLVTLLAEGLVEKRMETYEELPHPDDVRIPVYKITEKGVKTR